MKLPINNNNNNEHENVSFTTLEKKMMEEVMASAEVQRQKMIIKGKLDQENTKMMSQMMHNMNKSQLYGLNEQEKIELMQQQYQQMEQPEKQIKSGFGLNFGKGKNKIIAALIAVIMLILAIGITPTGAWAEAIQTSYVELLVDAFRMGLLGFGGYLICKLFKNGNN